MPEKTDRPVILEVCFKALIFLLSSLLGKIIIIHYVTYSTMLTNGEYILLKDVLMLSQVKNIAS